MNDYHTARNVTPASARPSGRMAVTEPVAVTEGKGLEGWREQSEKHDPANDTVGTEKKRLPQFWVGFVISSVLFVVQVTSVILPDSWKIELLLSILGMCGGFYWLYCVQEIRNYLSEHSSDSIGLKNILILHFIPVFNLYWLFHWNQIFSKYISNNGIQIINGIGTAMIILALILFSRLVDGPIGLCGMFGILLYYKSRIIRLPLKS